MTILIVYIAKKREKKTSDFINMWRIKNQKQLKQK